MLGKSIFKQEDQVTFTAIIDGKEKRLDGVVYVVDIYGTDEQCEEPSYDIQALYEGDIVLFKHIPESRVAVRG